VRGRIWIRGECFESSFCFLLHCRWS
jgi:hypothetical protein